MNRYHVEGTVELAIDGYSEEHVRDILKRLDVELPDGQGMHLHIASVTEAHP